MRKEVEKKVPLPRALFYVLLSVVVIWGVLFLSWWCHDFIVKQRMEDERFTVEGVVVCATGPDVLPSWHLTALLGLTTLTPQNLYSYDIAKAENAFALYPACREAQIRRVRPNALYISYEMRKPKFHLVDFENVAIDEDGYPFFLSPIYSPKRLVQLQLGVSSLQANCALSSDEFYTAKKVLGYLELFLPKSMKVVKIDTQKLFAPSRGLREIVAVVENKSHRYYLRLPTKEYKKSTRYFAALIPTLEQMKTAEVTSQVVDLRGIHFALVKNHT